MATVIVRNVKGNSASVGNYVQQWSNTLYIWYSSKYLGHQDNICQKNKIYSIYISLITNVTTTEAAWTSCFSNKKISQLHGIKEIHYLGTLKEEDTVKEVK